MRALVVGGAEAAAAAELLARRGHAVVTAEGPDAATGALARGPTPDLVFVAATDGAAAVRAIRAVRAHVRGEAAALVALVPEGSVGEALDAGANHALPSPVPRAHLVATVAAAERAAPHIRAAAAPSDPGHDLYFTRNPSPMWFYDLDTLAFVAVNEAAVRKSSCS